MDMFLYWTAYKAIREDDMLWQTFCLPKEVLQDGDTGLLKKQGRIKCSFLYALIPPH